MNEETKVIVEFDKEKCEKRLEKRLDKSFKKLTAQILKDSNYYAPKDTGTLINSGIVHTNINRGTIVWEDPKGTPYARIQYYEHPNKSHLNNPNARCKWFEYAKSVKIKNWEKLVNDEYNKSSE